MSNDEPSERYEDVSLGDIDPVQIKLIDIERQRQRLLDKMFGLSKGSRLAHYEIIEELGRGSMGIVYAALDHKLERKVAIKRIFGDDQQSRQRSVGEAKAMARLAHPNVVTVFEVCDVDDRTFIVMEYIDGETLHEWLGTRPNWRKILAVFIDAGRGLAAAHERGLVHGDFKPGNVMIGRDGRVSVMDFGLARADPSRADTSLSNAPDSDHYSPIAGTPAYMAPEQFRGRWVDALSDQFSFCVALSEGIFARSPFMGATQDERWQAAENGEICQPPKSEVPREIFAVIARGLEPAPDRRFGSMRELLAALREAVSTSSLEFGLESHTFQTAPRRLPATTETASERTLMTETLENSREDPVPRWQLLEELGSGAMGSVWLAERADGAFQMKAAVKLLKHGIDSPGFIKRSMRERQILADLDHPNICRLLDGGTMQDGRPYLVMEYIDGYRIDDFCRGECHSERAVIELGIQLCEALSCVHAKGVVHRDLKPSNILVTRAGQPKIVDFGIARVIDSDDRNTLAGQRVMTPAYASPEQWRGLEAEATSDIFSLAVVLVELLTGERNARPGPRGASFPASIQSALGDKLYAIFARALHSDPGRRYPSMAAFGAALRYHLGSQGAAVTSSPAPAGGVPMIESRESGQRHYLTTRCILGRSPRCQICVPVSRVSGVHAEIVWTGSSWTLHDLGSRNGTFLEGRRLDAGERATLVEGAVLWLGGSECQFLVLDDAPPKLVAIDSDNQSRFAEGGILCLPANDTAEIMIFSDDTGNWILESAEGLRDVRDAETLLVSGRSWSLHLPNVQAQTT
ncbi:MAG: protein kinase, partial [Myxococcales bacterium]|nr:protein kinase [Myxococcales bacterium]